MKIGLDPNEHPGDGCQVSYERGSSWFHLRTTTVPGNGLTMNDRSEPVQPPAPPGGWIMHMRWSNLLFMHWPVPAESLRPFIPAGLEIDRFDGQAWLGIVPFTMSNVRPRFIPPMPGVSAFPELNVRTYVTHDGKPGVWFFSLDAANKLAVRGARRLWHLPYFDARMSMDIRDREIHYQSTRTHKDARPASLTMRYKPVGPTWFTTPGTLDHFLISRLSLYSADRAGRIYRGEIHHVSWPLQHAEAEIESNEMTKQLDLKLPGIAPLLHYAERLDVVGWRIARV